MVHAGRHSSGSAPCAMLGELTCLNNSPHKLVSLHGARIQALLPAVIRVLHRSTAAMRAGFENRQSGACL